jgi:hypothetical protein
MDLDDLIAEWQPSIEPAIRRTCAKWCVTGADAEDLTIELWLCLLPHDGRVLRRFEGRSAKATICLACSTAPPKRLLKKALERTN